MIWDELSKRCRGGIRRRSEVDRPLDLLLPQVLDLLNIRMAIMPRQGSTARSSNQPAVVDNGQAKLLAELQKQINTLRNEPKPKDKHALAIQDAFRPKAILDRPAPSPPKTKGLDAKAKRNDKKKAPRAPAALKGCVTKSSDATGNVKMCYAYNLGNCKVVGDRCPNGEHICMKALTNGQACSEKHPQLSCTRR
jgi:hypothetical protein